MNVHVRINLAIHLDESEQFEYRTATYNKNDRSYNFRVDAIRTTLPESDSVLVSGYGVSKKGNRLLVRRETYMNVTELSEPLQTLIQESSRQAEAMEQRFNTK